jgi:dUTP pyrophosphatase
MTINSIDKVNIILPYKTVKFETNIYTEIPEEDEMQIRPRSGISSTTLLDVKFGTVDNDWRGNSGIIVQNPTPVSYIIIPNSRLAQGVIVEKKRAVFDIKSSKDELSKTERGENGFGKSGLM